MTPGSIDALVIPNRLDDKPALYKSPALRPSERGGGEMHEYAIEVLTGSAEQNRR